jgi:beta-galactosidase
MDPRKDLSAYPVVFAPRAFLLDDLIAANLTGYVRAGGTLILTAATGVVDMYGRCFAAPRPGPLAETAGLDVSDLSAVKDSIGIVGTDGFLEGFEGSGMTVCDEIHPGTAQVIATYASGWRKGLPAITMNRYGDGAAIYIGTILDEASMQAFVSRLLEHTGIRGILQTQEGVRVYRKKGDESELWFLINRRPDTVIIQLPEQMLDLLNGNRIEEVTVPSAGVSVLEKRVPHRDTTSG